MTSNEGVRTAETLTSTQVYDFIKELDREMPPQLTALREIRGVKLATLFFRGMVEAEYAKPSPEGNSWAFPADVALSDMHHHLCFWNTWNGIHGPAQPPIDEVMQVWQAARAEMTDYPYPPSGQT